MHHVLHFQLQDLIQQYGYWALAIGSLIEGETVLIMAGYAAHRGYLHLDWVILIAALAGFAGDQLFFTLGRARGRQLVARFPSIQAQAARVEHLIDRYHTWLIVGVRFMYGLRVAGPVLLGMSEVSHLRFAAFNLLGALIWATLVGGAGYLFGHAVELFLHDAERYELIVLVLLLVAGVVFWLYRAKHREKARG